MQNKISTSLGNCAPLSEIVQKYYPPLLRILVDSPVDGLVDGYLWSLNTSGNRNLFKNVILQVVHLSSETILI